MPTDELRFAKFAEQPLRADADVVIHVDEQAKLIGEIEIGLVVWRGGQQDDPTVIGVDVLGDGTIALAFPVAKVMAFVDEHKTIAAQVRKFALDVCHRQDFGSQPILLAVVLPHRHQVLRAEDEGFDAVVILEDPGQGRCHQGLPEADDIADYDAATFVEMMCGDLDSRLLELEQSVAEVGGNAELVETGASFLGQVIRHLHIDVIGRNRLRSRPTGVDDLDQFLRDVDAEAVSSSGPRTTWRAYCTHRGRERRC